MLIAAGLDAGRAPEHWVLDHPERITEAHRRYLDAGADVIQAVTFGANPLKLQTAGLPGRARDVNVGAVQLARGAVGESDVWVSGNIGPTGKFFPPMGDATSEQIDEAFSEQAELLAGAGVDLITVETMYDLREARAAVCAAQRTGLPVLASMTFEVRPRGFFTIMGDRLVPSLATLSEDGAAVVGFNCSAVSDQMVPMVEEAVAGLDVPIMVQPNAGQPRATLDGVVYDADPGEFVADLMRMVDIGARVIGGCCGTDPDFIARARRALDAR